MLGNSVIELFKASWTMLHHLCGLWVQTQGWNHRQFLSQLSSPTNLGGKGWEVLVAKFSEH